MKSSQLKKVLKKVWYFIWEDNSIWSWIVNVILAFVLIKFIVYPALGFILGTGFPIVAVVSGSMEHNNGFEQWWDSQHQWYENHNISKQDFQSFIFKNGFNKGDIMILKGAEPEDIDIGEIIVYRNSQPDPIIHRVIKKWRLDDKYYFQTKGDNNLDSGFVDKNISEQRIVGKAMFRVPLLGYIKIWFVELIKLLAYGLRSIVNVLS